jgi:hypothetical protein
VVVVQRKGSKGPLVKVLPVTHSPPNDYESVLELPMVTKQRFGLDSGRSWIVLDECNDFSWPGPDLRPAANGDLASVAYGMLPAVFVKTLRARLLARIVAKKAKTVLRQ